MGIFTHLITASRNGGPRRAAPTGVPADPISRDQPLRTILIASGDEEERQTWIDCLAHPQHRVLVAENGEAALRAIYANNPDLLIAAMSMPRLDGLELLRMIHEIAPGVRVILIAKGNRQVDRSYMKLAKLLGAVATFTQPLDERTFLSDVRTALDLDTSSD